MNGLELLLYVKIGFTLVTCVGPMLLLSEERVTRLLGVDASAVGLVRLYGIALTALLVAYGSGLLMAADGVFPTGIVVMGVVSNLGGSGYLFATGDWRRAPALPAVFATLGAGLVWALVTPEAFLQPLAG